MHSPRDTRARAPGKLMLAGEYAILHGGEAWVMAVDRHAVARDRVEGDTSFVPPEARAAWEEATREGLLRAMPDEGAFTIDLSAMNHDGRKLGVGSSAAGCVAALAWAIGREGRASSVPRRHHTHQHLHHPPPSTRSARASPAWRVAGTAARRAGAAAST